MAQTLDFKARLTKGGALFLACSFLLAAPFACIAQQASGQNASANTAAAPAPGTLFPQDKLSTLLPATVYFAGRTAPLQLRNAAAIQLAGNNIVWASLVDSSGYASSVQEKYQFYFVTEGPVRFGNVELRAGAYGGGFVGERFVLLDLGNHTIGEGPTQADAALRRPRPLQMVADQPNSVKLYLGRRWVTIQSAAR